MNNEEKTKEILDCENCKKQLFIGGVKCPPACADYNDLIKMAQWKDEQVKQLLIEKTKLLSPSAAQDSVKRCTIEEIYRELFNEEMSNSNPL